jgi:hypothetical protein
MQVTKHVYRETLENKNRELTLKGITIPLF